jgi:hypothetical protein
VWQGKHWDLDEGEVGSVCEIFLPLLPPSLHHLRIREVEGLASGQPKLGVALGWQCEHLSQDRVAVLKAERLRVHG